MAEIDINEILDPLGGFLKLSTQPDDEKKDTVYDQPDDFKDEKFRYAVYAKEEEQTDSKFRYVTYLVPEEGAIEKHGSTCTFSINEPDDEKLSDWGKDPAITNDSYLGFFYDKTISPRYRAMVVMLGKGSTVPTSSPISQPDYSPDDNNIVLWSGFNKTGAELSAGGAPGDKIRMTFSGIEQAINDLSVNGIIGWELYSVMFDNRGNHATNTSQQTNPIRTNAFEFTFHSYAYKAIFNEDGRPDQMDFVDFPADDNSDKGPSTSASTEQEKGATLQNRYFNKAGEGPIKYWTIGDILIYLSLWYIQVDANLDQKLPDTFSIKTKFNDYVIQSGQIPSELFNEIPTDLSLEGLGVYDAFVEVMRHSTRYDISGGYDNDGKFRFNFVPKLETTGTGTVIRSTSEFEITMSRGDFGAAYNENKIVNNSILNANRENSRIGRVIVIGDRVRINTLFTTLANTGVDDSLFDAPRLSDDADDYAAVVSPKIVDADWSKYLALYTKDTLNDNGTPGAIFNFSTLNAIKDQSNNFMKKLLPLIASELNDDTKIDIADSFEVPTIERGIKSSFSEEHTLKQDKGIFVTDKIVLQSEDNPDEDNSKSGFDWMFVIPIERSAVVAGRIATNSGRAGAYLELYPKPKTLAVDAFNQLFERTSMFNRIGSGGALVKSLSTRRPMPLFARVTLVSQYRLKGIAKITKATHGIDFDPEKHATKIINDDRFKLNLTFNDATYSTTKTNNIGNENNPDALNGSFIPIADGFIPLRGGGVDPQRTEPITNIQKEADGWLDRLVTIPQNSGTLNLRSIQKGIRVGQFIEKLEGGSRSIDFKCFIQSIRYDFLRWEMSIGLGNVNEQPPR